MLQLHVIPTIRTLTSHGLEPSVAFHRSRLQFNSHRRRRPHYRCDASVLGPCRLTIQIQIQIQSSGVFVVVNDRHRHRLPYISLYNIPGLHHSASPDDSLFSLFFLAANISSLVSQSQRPHLHKNYHHLTHHSSCLHHPWATPGFFLFGGRAKGIVGGSNQQQGICP